MSQATYEAVTFRILEALQKGVVPWRKPWQIDSAWPINGFSGREYRGINLFLLGCTKFQDHRWLTFRQARELGGYVKAGENSSIAVFWKRWEVEKEEEHKKTIPLLKHYHVFNAEQCADIKIPPLEKKPSRPKNERIKAAQDLICSMADGPILTKIVRLLDTHSRLISLAFRLWRPSSQQTHSRQRSFMSLVVRRDMRSG